MRTRQYGQVAFFQSSALRLVRGHRSHNPGCMNGSCMVAKSNDLIASGAIGSEVGDAKAVGVGLSVGGGVEFAADPSGIADLLTSIATFSLSPPRSAYARPAMISTTTITPNTSSVRRCGFTFASGGTGACSGGVASGGLGAGFYDIGSPLLRGSSVMRPPGLAVSLGGAHHE